MTTRFGKFNFKLPVTAIEVDPNVVLTAQDGKVVVGMGKKKRVKKTDAAYTKAAGYMPRFIKQVNWQTGENQTNTPKPGDKLNVSIFESGDEVKVTGTTKGRGFAGGIKRHGFHGGPKTHGQSDRHRAPGSIGSGTTPGRVWKGKKMAGHMGASKLTVTGLEVVEVDVNNSLIYVKGAVPGPRTGFVILEKTGKVKGYTPPPPPNEEKMAEKEEKAEAEAKEAKEESKADASSDSDPKEVKQTDEKAEAKTEEPTKEVNTEGAENADKQG